jgi:probable F420-dependent oxidoreductase
MRVETSIAGDLKKVPALARQAEALGFDSVSAPELAHDAYLPLLLAAEHTQRVKVANSIALAFPRSPMITAHLAWDLQGFSDGRFELGLGTQVKGHIERRYSIPWTPPGPRLRDYIGALRAIWETWSTGKPLNYRSANYNLTLMTPYFTPPPIAHPNIPITIAAVGDYMARLAGELCDGIRLHGFTTPKYIAEVTLPNIEKGLAKSGRSRKDFTIYMGGFLAVGETRAEIEKGIAEARKQIAFYSSTRTYHPVLEIHGWKAFGDEMHELSLRGEWDAMASKVTDEMVEAFTIIGTYDQLASELKKRLGNLVDVVRLSLPPAGSSAERQVAKLIAELHRDEEAGS